MKTLLILSGLGISALVAELTGLKKYLHWFVTFGLLAAIGVTIKDWNTNIHYFNNMMVLDNTALMFIIVLCFLGFVWFLGARDYIESETAITDHIALLMFAMVGGMVMVSFQHMVMLFLGIEILSLSLYVLAGSRKNDLFSNEAAIKYFLMGSFASGFLLFGIALIYGVTGSFHLDQIGQIFANPAAVSKIALVGLVMMLGAMAFKISAVPFHFWTPDVYYGSPTQVTAFMSTIAKTAAIAALFRLVSVAFPHLTGVWSYALIYLAVLTMIVGNVLAVYQSEVKRMLAYSSIAHAGYMLMALLSVSKYSQGSLVYYSLSYGLGSLLAFNIFYIVTGNVDQKGGFSSFNGLARKSPLLAGCALLSMLSLAGIPPLSGFFAKYYVFSSALESGHRTLVFFAIVASLISIYYYFRIIIAAFSPVESPDNSAIQVTGVQRVLLLFCSLALILLGLFPDSIIRWI